MAGSIDLHTHTTASDGSMRPAQLVRHAHECGLSAVAITDHDTVAGIEEALAEGKASGVRVLPGVEISVDFNPEMHILGYFPEDTYMMIEDRLEELKKNRNERNPKIIKKLNELCFEITLEEVENEALGNIIGRPHIAQVLIKKGYARSMQEVFEKYLADGRPAYFKKDKLNPGEGIKLILSAGGLPVLAHPIFLGLDIHKLDNVLKELKTAGLAGIEAYYVENTHEDTGSLLRMAIKHNLLVTGGSDYHGVFKPDIELGAGHGNLHVSYELFEKLEGALQKKNPIL